MGLRACGVQLGAQACRTVCELGLAVCREPTERTTDHRGSTGLPPGASSLRPGCVQAGRLKCRGQQEAWPHRDGAAQMGRGGVRPQPVKRKKLCR